jgi:hypothetical protein
MAELLSPEKLNTNGPLIGKQLFDVITSGMYDNPLMIYREYIQNAVDSIDFASRNGLMSHDKGNIKIYLDGEKREIIIEDNGAGISGDRAAQVLSSLGMSPKEGQLFRGFRGIGRLGGLAYCDELIFETRSHRLEDVVQVTWDRKVFDMLSSSGGRQSLKSAIERISHVRYVCPDKSDPSHFFRVSLKGVRRFHNDLLMNLKSVATYLSQVAPVPYNRESFRFADDVHSYFSTLSDYHCYYISLNGNQIFRPYTSNFSVSKNRTDTIQAIEYISFVDANQEPLALGWYANTEFLASLPQHISMRGVRIRQGNIEIGDEHFLDETYLETRFAGWHIGEIHVCDSKLTPNARRDSFELSANYEKFLEQAQLLGRRLSGFCRRASNLRMQRERLERELSEVDKLLNRSKTYIDDSNLISIRRRIETRISDIEKVVEKFFPGDGYQIELTKLKKRCSDFIESACTLDSIVDGRKLRNISQRALLKHVVAVVFENYNRCDSPQELVEQIVDQFAKKRFAPTNGRPKQ